jgi:protein involved in polysaccharide export with SLBB domain
VGEVASPGLVEIPARASVMTALLAAGGPNKSGSLRRIRLDQNGASTEIDLYSFLTMGERSALTLLQPGAVIVVPPVGQTAAVAGLVQRPGIYELKDGANIQTLLTYAGGLTAFTFTPQAQIERTVAGRGRQKFDAAITGDGLSQPVGDGELLLIGAVDTSLQPSVAVIGQVVRPGTYEYKPGLKVSDLVSRADGLTIDAYLPQALISRQVGQVGDVSQVLDRVSVGSSRRVIVVDLAKAMAHDPAHDIELMPLDQLDIRSVSQSLERARVTVLGAVRQPGTYELSAGLKVSALVAMAGNLTSDVYYDEAELVRRVRDDATTTLDIRRFRFNLGAALRGGDDDPELRNGDQLVIRSMRAAQVKVRIEGEVAFPGEYVFPAGSRITDIISAAGGVTEHADLRAAGFFRRSAEQAERERLTHLAEQTRRAYEGALEHLVKDGQAKEGLAGKLALLQTQDLMDRIQRTDVRGRIVIPFVRSDFPTSAYNLAVEDGDRLVIPRRRETVGVVGLVFNPTNFVAEAGITVGSVIERAGGLAEYADDKRIYVIRADGTVESLAQTGDSRLAMGTSLLGGDVVLVPRAPLERSFGAELADVLALARQAAEVALLTSRLGNVSGQLDVTTVLPGSGQPQSVQDYSDTILNRRR